MDTKGRKVAIVAMAEKNISDSIMVIHNITKKQRAKVFEFTLDMAGVIEHYRSKMISKCGACNLLVPYSRNCHLEALKEILVAHRGEALNEESNDIENSKRTIVYTPLNSVKRKINNNFCI